MMKNYKLKVNILDFGAKTGSNLLQTESIQSAIDYCFKNGGGEIQIPAGEFITGAIRLRSNITLHLLEDAKLIGSRNPNDYFILQKDIIEPVPNYILTNETKINGRSIDGVHYGKKWFNSLIKVYNAKNIAIIGEKNSIIDGRDCYDENGEEGFRGPHCISICKSKNIDIYGITIVNSANWAYCIWSCKNVTCKNSTIKAGHDGFDVFDCENVLVEDCDFYTGDDCIAGYANYKVRISNCKLSSTCSAFRFAGTNVKISNCKVEGNSKFVHRYTLTKDEKITGKLLSDLENPNHRYRMKSFYTYYADNRLEIIKKPSKITIENCTVENSEKFLHYNYSGNETWQQNRPLYDISFKNIVVKNISMPMIAYGSQEEPFTLNLESVDILLSNNYTDDCLIRSANLKSVNFNKVCVKNFNGETVVKNYGENKGKIAINCSDFGNEIKSAIKETKQEFVVDCI